ncbi:PecA family PE domain-processing aspartic protease [Mycobacterium sp.]|uniref:PecA family PE domain-processing aspartic protease n=1 Tax=Mycobacterium sp. TaxID=1785 RepID=UPI0012859F1A|nr:PecA family PE domain-processing aspartic protease [Mycobacterium sp.]KAA8969836.1 MAG: hypothetical protein F6Q13_01870 [Mycobacterium sp.]
MARTNAIVVGALLSLGLTPLLAGPAAHADVEDLILSVLDVADWGALVPPGAGPDLDAPGAAEAIASTLGAGSTADPAATLSDATASVPLTVEGVGAGQPVVDVSLSGGQPIPVALDTGSKGLEVSIGDVPSQDVMHALRHFSVDDLHVNLFPAGINIGLEIPTTVGFGDGIVADHALVDAVFFSFPFSVIGAQRLAGAPVDGILGIGPNAGGSHLVTTDLPGDLSDGVLIDEPAKQLVFGPEPDTVDGLSPIATLDGAPFAGSPFHPQDLQVQIGSEAKHDVAVVFDSGGKGGWLPPSLADGYPRGLLGFGNVPDKTPISVYTPDGELLYSYPTSGGSGAMIIVPGWLLRLLGIDYPLVNTGNAAFLEDPVYISNADGGTMTFYGPTVYGSTQIPPGG